MSTRSLIALATIATALAAPQAASASDLYVQAGAGNTICTQDDPCNLGQAITIADIVSNRDTIHVAGPLSAGGVNLANSPIDLIGSGSGTDGTNFVSNGTALHLGPQSSATGVSVDGGIVGVLLDAGAVLRNARVRSQIYGIDENASSDRATTIDGVDVGAGGTGIKVSGLADGAETTITDSHVSANIGVDDLAQAVKGGAFHLERSTIESSDVAVQVGLTTRPTITNSVIRSTVDGVRARAGAHIGVDGSTIDGLGVGRDGVWVEGLTAARVDLRGSIVRGFDKDLNATDNPGPAGSIVVGRSDYATSDGPGIIELGGNLNVPPHWLDPSAGDYRLAADSPLVDAGNIDPSQPGETDRAAMPRNVDGDGNGSAARDIGAYEYQYVPPSTTPHDPPSTTPQDSPSTTPQDSPGNVDTTSPGGNQEQSGGAGEQPAGSPRQPAPAGAPQPTASPFTVGLGGRRLVLDRRGRGSVTVTCSAAPCKLKLVIATTGKHPHKLGQATGRAGKLKLRLSRSALAYARNHRVRKVAISAVATDASGRTARGTKTLIILVGNS